jgi:hypothetical protein
VKRHWKAKASVEKEIHVDSAKPVAFKVDLSTLIKIIKSAGYRLTETKNSKGKTRNATI